MCVWLGARLLLIGSVQLQVATVWNGGGVGRYKTGTAAYMSGPPRLVRVMGSDSFVS